MSVAAELTLSDWQTAIHEAAHAVIARVLKLACGEVSIVENEEEGEAGYALIADPLETASAWEDPLRDWFGQRVGPAPRVKDCVHAFRGTILARMAGAEAEIAFFGACRDGDGDDRYWIDEMARSSDAEFSSDEEWERFEPRMRRQTRRLVHRHRLAIERVAEALTKRGGKLSGRDVDAIVGPMLDSGDGLTKK